MLTGKVILVTGASRGIGLSVAKRFAESGATLHLVARSESVVELAEDLASRFSVSVTPHVGDVCDDKFVKGVIGACRKAHGKLDALVNNAGMIQQGLLGMIPLEQTRSTFEVNVLAVINLTQYAVRIMGPGASIINMASIAGTKGMEGTPAYSASKGAVVGFTLSIAKELAKKKIRANAIAPGFIDTDMTRGLAGDWYQKRIDSIGMGRIGEPDDIAKVALFLASDLAGYVTGQIIGVDGGMLA
jgi:3-oxoacyl-[acyl-carrier protein] reductase